MVSPSSQLATSPNEIQVFNFQDSSLRMIGLAEKPEFVGLDVVNVLYPGSDPRTRSNYLSKVPKEWKGSKKIATNAGQRKTTTVTEPGLYYLIARSNSALAVPFQRWVFEEVLPSIRKTGSYGLPAVPVCALDRATDDTATLIELAHRFNFGGGEAGKARCRKWIRSVGIGDNEWVQYSSPRDVRLPRHLLPRLDEAINDLRCVELADIEDPVFVSPRADDSVVKFANALVVAASRIKKIVYLKGIEQTRDLAINLANEVLDDLMEAEAEYCGNADQFHWLVENNFHDKLTHLRRR